MWPAAARGSHAAEGAVVAGEFHEQHCEAHSLLPQHERLMAQMHSE
jgi:hypothetical protein